VKGRLTLPANDFTLLVVSNSAKPIVLTRVGAFSAARFGGFADAAFRHRRLAEF
jgi:hypothetical protein